MLRTILNAIRRIPALATKVRTEPVMLVTLAMIVLGAFQEASAASLGGEDLLLYVGEAVLGWFARELVVPTAKIEGSGNFVDEGVDEPAILGANAEG